MKNTILIAGCLILGTLLHGQDAREIMKKSHSVVKVSSFEAVSTLTITDSRGNTRVRKNTMASKMFEDGTEKRIVKFIAPVEVAGTGLLIFDHESKADDMWIYLPALRKTRRIVSSEKSKSFMGSEFSNADMTAPSLDEFTYEILGSEEIDGTSHWKISATPVSIDLEDEYGYSKSISWINKNDYLVRKREYFDFNGESFKIIENLEHTLLDPGNQKYMITDMTADNTLQGRRSRMKMDQIAIADTKDEYFTVSFLEK
jgi:hypothetical protein